MAVDEEVVSPGEQLDLMVLHLLWAERGVLLIAGTPDDELEKALVDVLAGRIEDRVKVTRFTFSATPVENLSLSYQLRRLPPADGARVLFVHGLDHLSDRARQTAIDSLNWGRERLAWAGCSVVLWVRSHTIGDLMMKAPDFFSWRRGVVPGV